MVDKETIGRIGEGLLVYLGIGKDDSERDVDFIAEKLINLRLFPDENGKMNLSVTDVNGSILLISQFTLYGDCRKGRRPSFDPAADPDIAKKLFQEATEKIHQAGIKVATGRFAAHMDVKSTNHGPVTLLLDSKKAF